jgi:hypothetical protein
VGDLTTLPGVRLLSLPGQPTSVLRAAGIAAAHGEAIALVDPACQLAPSWLAAARQALAQAPLASGPVAYGSGRQLVTWTAFLAEYGAFLATLLGARWSGRHQSYRPSLHLRTTQRSRRTVLEGC